jgi:hypothetical protein
MAINLELLHLLEDKLGKETARKVAQAIEMLASKADLLELRKDIQIMEAKLEAKIELVRKELSGEIGKVKAEISAKIENEILRLDRKFTIMFIILFFTLILFNQNALEFLLKVLGVIK